MHLELALQRGQLEHEIFFSPSPPREEKGPGDGQPHFTQEGIEKDRIRSQWLNRLGIEVIRFTSHEIKINT